MLKGCYMRQTKEDKAAYGGKGLFVAPLVVAKKGANKVTVKKMEVVPIADIVISEYNTVTITPVSETKSSHETN
jgi:hypothetical protein